MVQEEFEGIIISFSVWMEKQVALQGGELLCEVSEVKNVDAVTRVGAERGLSTLSTKSRYCEVELRKSGSAGSTAGTSRISNRVYLIANGNSSPPLDVGEH